ncbi:MAG: hypothetical protein ACYDBQ_07215 [Thermoplasmatota archaeon]
METPFLTPLRRVLVLLALPLLVMSAWSVAAQDPAAASPAPAACQQPGQNMQCSAFGTISMPTQVDIRGQAVQVTAQITLTTNYGSQGARWLLFSIRNNTSPGPSPISLSLVQLATATGPLTVTRVQHDSPSQIDLWVDVLDTPVGTPISLTVQVGASDRGAFRLETLVMAFDRGYASLQQADGTPASLFSFTELGVNQESSTVGTPASGGSIFQGHKTPFLGEAAVIAVIGLAALVGRRRA